MDTTVIVSGVKSNLIHFGNGYASLKNAFYILGLLVCHMYACQLSAAVVG